MARISGVNLPPKKQIETALTYVLGIGNSLSKKILQQANIAIDRRVESLSADEIHKIQEVISSQYKVEGDIRRVEMMSIKRLRDINCWRGSRHVKGLPARGQRTKSNNRTIRGNMRRTVSSGRRAAPAPK